MLWVAHQHLEFDKTLAPLTSKSVVLGAAVTRRPSTSGVHEVFCDAGHAVFAAQERARALPRRR